MRFLNYMQSPEAFASCLRESADQSIKFLKTLTQEEIDDFASLSDGYDKEKGRWGDCSMWIVSAVNRAVKAGKSTAEEIWKYKDTIRTDIEAFRTYKKELGNNIDAFRGFADLHAAVSKYVGQGGKVVPKLVTSKLSNRIRSALSKMKQPGMSKVLDNDKFYVSSPDNVDVNRTMASVGHWCHTGNPQSGTSDAQAYWDEYTAYGPLYYVLYKQSQFVLCISYARQKEIRNQFDMRPYETESGSGIWRVDAQKGQTRDQLGVPYDNSDKDWDSFMKWLDSSNELPKAILLYEDEWESKQADLMREAFVKDTADLTKKIKNGVFRIDSEETANRLKNLMRAGLRELPYEEDYDEGGDHEGEDFDEAYDAAVEFNASRKGMFRRVVPLITELLGNMSAIAPGKFASGLFAEIGYDGELPEIDLDGTEDASRMFFKFGGRNIPNITNAKSVTRIDSMFYGCDKVETLPDLVFENAKYAITPFYGMKSLHKVGNLIFPSIIRASSLIPCQAEEIGDIDVSSLRNPLSQFETPYWSAPDTLKSVGNIKFSEDAAFTQDFSMGSYRVPSIVFIRFAEACGKKLIGNFKRDADGYLVIDSIKSYDYNKPNPAFATTFMTSLFEGYNVTSADIKVVAELLLILGTERFKTWAKVPYVKISKKTYSTELSPDDFKPLLATNGEIDSRYAGKIKVVDEAGGVKTLTAKDIQLKADSKSVRYDDEGRLIVKTPADARFAAKHHNELKAIDITNFWDNARYELGFWLWIRNYLKDIEVEDDRDEDHSRHYETRLPKIRMTQAQWDSRNEEGPIFDKALNLADRYGKTCDGDSWYRGSDNLLSMPDFVEIADPKKELDEKRSKAFVAECEALTRRLRLGD